MSKRQRRASTLNRVVKAGKMFTVWILVVDVKTIASYAYGHQQFMHVHNQEVLQEGK